MVPPTCFLAFDLPNGAGEMVLKPYLFPHRRALLERKSTNEVVFEAVRKLDRAEGLELDLALQKVQDFLGMRGAGTSCDVVIGEGQRVVSNLKEMSIEMLSFDCVAPLKSRVKLYAKTTDTLFSNVSRTYTMGGIRTGAEVDEGLLRLKESWTCLFGHFEDGSEGDNREDSFARTASKFLFFGFEIAPGKKAVDVKVYVPMWTAGLGGEVATETLGVYFRGLGWDVGVDSWRLDGRGGNGGGAGYTYISFAYSARKGVYVTSYFTPTMQIC